MDDLIKALRCLASIDPEGDCYEEQYNLRNDGQRISCYGSPETIMCPYHQNTYDVCFEDGDCGNWLNEVAKMLEELQQYRDRIEQLKHAEVIQFRCKLPDGRICHFSDFIDFLEKGEVK